MKCDECPAAAEWPWFGRGLFCFDYAYFDGKPGKPKLCNNQVKACTRIINQEEDDLIIGKVTWEDEAEPIDIIMDRENMSIAAHAGVDRHLSALFDNRKDAYGANTSNGWQMHVEGALGEKALADYLGIKWDPKIGLITKGDVGKIEVRTTGAHTKRSDLRRTHKRDMMIQNDQIMLPVPFVHITGLEGNYKFHGWILGPDAKKVAVYEDRYNLGRPTNFIPTVALRDMKELKKLVAEGHYV